MTDKIKVLPQPKTDEMIKALRTYMRNADEIIEYNKIDAKIKRAKFLSLVDAGFTKQEALELCK